MRRLHVKYFKYVAANGDLDAATEKELVNSEAVEKVEQHIVEAVTSKNKNPRERYRVGRGISLKAMLYEATQADQAVFFGGSVASESYTVNQTVAKLAKYDLRLGIYDGDSGLVYTIDYTDMQFVGNMENSFKEAGSGIVNIAFEAMSTDTSDRTEDIDALTP